MVRGGALCGGHRSTWFHGAVCLWCWAVVYWCSSRRSWKLVRVLSKPGTLAQSPLLGAEHRQIMATMLPGTFGELVQQAVLLGLQEHLPALWQGGVACLGDIPRVLAMDSPDSFPARLNLGRLQAPPQPGADVQANMLARATRGRVRTWLTICADWGPPCAGRAIAL